MGMNNLILSFIFLSLLCTRICVPPCQLHPVQTRGTGESAPMCTALSYPYACGQYLCCRRWKEFLDIPASGPCIAQSRALVHEGPRPGNRVKYFSLDADESMRDYLRALGYMTVLILNAYSDRMCRLTTIDYVCTFWQRTHFILILERTTHVVNKMRLVKCWETCENNRGNTCASQYLHRLVGGKKTYHRDACT